MCLCDTLCIVFAVSTQMDTYFLAEENWKNNFGYFRSRNNSWSGSCDCNDNTDDNSSKYETRFQCYCGCAGCKVYGERPSITLEERLKAALKYLNANPDSACIVSGGQGADETISEAECMYLYLVNNGIAPDRIYKEDKSTTTRENLAFSYEIIKEHGLEEQIAIATNNFHEYRAGKVADSLGLEHGAVSGDTALWLLPTYYARELLAILYEWVF